METIMFMFLAISLVINCILIKENSDSAKLEELYERQDELLTESTNQLLEGMEIILKLNKALDKACNVLESKDKLVWRDERQRKSSDQWKEWLLKDEIKSE